MLRKFISYTLIVLALVAFAAAQEQRSEIAVQSACELFRENGAGAEGEREAMDDALYALRGWKIPLKNRTYAA